MDQVLGKPSKRKLKITTVNSVINSAGVIELMTSQLHTQVHLIHYFLWLFVLCSLLM